MSSSDQLRKFLSDENINLAADLFQDLASMMPARADPEEFAMDFQNFLEDSGTSIARISSETIRRFREQVQGARAMEEIDNGTFFVVADYDATLETMHNQATTAAAAAPSAFATPSTTGGIADQQPSKNHFPTSFPTPFKGDSHGTPSKRLANVGAFSTPSSSAHVASFTSPSSSLQTVRSNMASPWANILASPSTSHSLSDRSGSVVASHSSSQVQLLVGDAMFAERSNTTSFIPDQTASNSRRRPLPIFNVSYIYAEATERRKRKGVGGGGSKTNFSPNVPPQAYESFDAFTAAFPPSDPFAPRAPFRFMQWGSSVYSSVLNNTLKTDLSLREALLTAPVTQTFIDPTGTNASAEDHGGSGVAENQIRLQPDFGQSQIKDGWYFGHIKDTVSTEPGQRLTMSTIMLSNNVTEAPLRLTHRSLLHFSLFPGQRIALRATNVTGKMIFPDVIFSETSLEQYHRAVWIKRFYVCYYDTLKQHLQNRRKALLAQFGSVSGPALANNPTATSTMAAVTAQRSLMNLPSSTTTKNEPSDTQSNSSSLTAHLHPEMKLIEQDLARIPSQDQVLSLEHRPTRVMFCSGPYLSNKGTVQSISAIVDAITKGSTAPDVLILAGPFINPNSVQLQTNHTTQSVWNDPSADPFVPGKRTGEDKSTSAPIPQTPSTSDAIPNNPSAPQATPSTTTPATTTTSTTTATATTTTTDAAVSLCNVPVFTSNVYSSLSSAASTAVPQSIHTYEYLFNDMMDSLISALNAFESTQNLTIITVPSPQDLHHFACYPQPAFTYSYPAIIRDETAPPPTTSIRVINAPNPVLLDINGTTFAITTHDTLFDLSRFELSFSADETQIAQVEKEQQELQQQQHQQSSKPQSTPSSTLHPQTHVELGTNPNPTSRLCRKDKRSVRLLSHLLSQQNLAPVSTGFYNSSLEEQTKTSSKLLFQPDILLVPSRLRYFVEPIPAPGCFSSLQPVADPSDAYLKEHGHVLAINAESAVKGEGLGYFASISFVPADMCTTNKSSTSERFVDIIDRCSAQIVHL